MTRTVMMADVFGRARFVSVWSKSEDMMHCEGNKYVLKPSLQAVPSGREHRLQLASLAWRVQKPSVTVCDFLVVVVRECVSYVRQTTGTPPPPRLPPQRGQQHTTAAPMNGIAESPPLPPPPLTPSAQQHPQQPQPLQQRPSPLTLTTLPQVLSALSSLESEEAELSNSLSALLRDHEPIQNALARLQSLLPRVDELHAEASALSGKVSVTARTAERVGGRVRTLDEEMRRVREASDRLQQVMELKVRRLFCFFACAGFLSPPFFVAFAQSNMFSCAFSTCTSRHCPLFSRPSMRKIGSRLHDTVRGPWPCPKA